MGAGNRRFITSDTNRLCSLPFGKTVEHLSEKKVKKSLLNEQAKTYFKRPFRGSTLPR